VGFYAENVSEIRLLLSVKPGSLIIDRVVTSEDSQGACIKYNSKNKFGIYVEKKTVVLEKISTQWTVHDTDVYTSSCTNAGLKQLDEGST